MGRCLSSGGLRDRRGHGQDGGHAGGWGGGGDGGWGGGGMGGRGDRYQWQGRTLASLLAHHLERDFVHYLTHGFHLGFSTGYTGPHTTRHAPSLQSAAGSSRIINEYLSKECKARHTAGLFSSPHFPTLSLALLGQSQKAFWKMATHNAPFVPHWQ